MQSQHSIYMESRHLYWPKPSSVVLRNGSLRCEFKPARYYDLQHSYSWKSKQGDPNPPHVQFMNALDEDKMAEFVKAWGPLWMTFDEHRDGRSVAHPLARYQAERMWLTAVNGLIHPVGETMSERERLAKYFDADAQRDRFFVGYQPHQESVTVGIFKARFNFQGSFAQWVAAAGIPDIHAGINLAIDLSVLASAPSVWIDWNDQNRTPRAGWQFVDLEQALHWMVWFDGYREDPVYCCQECRTFFKSDSKHRRKYCSNSRCAQRVAARKWRKANLEEKRRKKEAEQRKGKEDPC